MAKITRKHQKVFAGSATNNGVFGSAQAGTKVLSSDPDTIQGLAAFDSGWLSAVISGQKLPALEEMQALDFLITRQLSYLFQEGIPEYSASCEYHQNSIVKKSGTYELYGSLINTNTGNALPAAVSDSNWQYLGSLASMGGLTAASNAQSNAGSSSSVALVPSNFAQQSKSTNGYQKLPSGLIIQWGVNTGIDSAMQIITFPTAFPTACINIQLTKRWISGGTGYERTASIITMPDTSGFSYTAALSGSGVATYDVFWLAIGY